MRVVIQRVSSACVSVDALALGRIKKGLLVLVGITHDDNREDIVWISKKIANLRIFDDEYKVPNISVKDCKGDILMISQFTLYASTKKGNRPSYIQAAPPEVAQPLYEQLIVTLQQDIEKNIFTGKFGADMQVELVNDGPITIIIDSKERF